MTDNRKTTVPGASVGADAVQSSSKINTNIIIVLLLRGTYRKIY